MEAPILAVIVGGILILIGQFTDHLLNMRTGRELVRAGLWCLLLAIALLFLPVWAHARDTGQWNSDDPEKEKIRQWYQGLMMPDNPSISCCGEADAYWCDEISTREGKNYCAITDPRPDEPLGRPHIDLGVKFEIPDHKMKYDKGNPTGHAIIFLSRSQAVLCFVDGGGV